LASQFAIFELHDRKQGVLMVGFAAGLVLTLLLSAGMSALDSSLELRLSGASLLKFGVLSLAIATLAAAVPVRQIAGLYPAAVFRGK